ncbi:MAG: beta-ketoacyl synthase N-terminal-like domain-containing protein [Desulfococcaceae bacterium]
MKNTRPVAVVGMGGVFPRASDLNIFWQNIVSKTPTVSEVPEGRWIVPPDAMFHPQPMPDKAFSKKACLVGDEFTFDPNGFELDAAMIRELDTLYHMVLHAGRAAFAECAMQKVDRERIGVALAAIALPTDSASFLCREILGTALVKRLFGESEENIAKKQLSRNQCLSARVTSLPGAILARALGLGGGSFTLDAACASSLYAVKLACDELQSGRADAMLAGGVSRPECLYTQVGFSQLRALSPSGICAPFDRNSDGLVVGEGAGILVLKRLEDALSHGDTIYAVIRGMGLSNDMRGNLLAPDTEGQVRAMRAAYEMASLSPNDMDLIECHGAGTPVGDRTELISLNTLWGESAWHPGQCAIGSIKSMVGHLLTGAGAAGMIKTLLALQHQILPPSLNFTHPHENSPLHSSPFHVQSKAEEWKTRNANTPRRAAVSAFGFGGINAHLLFEEYREEGSGNSQRRVGEAERNPPLNTEHCPVAIIGMSAKIGNLKNLREFQEAVFNGESAIRKRPEFRWREADGIAEGFLDGQGKWGAYMEELSLYAGEFSIPPKEIPDILTQQLLMLKVAAAALKDAGLPLKEYRPRMGVTIGMEFDMEDTDFHLRWNLFNEMEKRKTGLSESEAAKKLEQMRDQIGQPLTSSRVLGSLGGIVASRVAREFRFGGPSYTVSAEAASGIKALEIAVRSLQQGECDLFLCGAVDLCGDVRNIAAMSGIKAFGKNETVRPFDRNADGSVPGEGAVALVLKPLDKALADGDRIYSVIKGFGSACAGGIDNNLPDKSAYLNALHRAMTDAQTSPETISYIETHGSADPAEDRIETEALHDIFVDVKSQPAIGSIKPLIGDTGAASGLASVVKTALCLYQEILPPLKNYTAPKEELWEMESFHIPAFPQFWLRDRKEGPRRACVASMNWDGNCAHVILEEAQYPEPNQIPRQILQERRRPLGSHAAGLFAVEADSPEELIRELDVLKTHAQNYDQMENAARAWYESKKGLHAEKICALSLVAKDYWQLETWIEQAKRAVLSEIPKKMTGPSGVSYFPEPLGSQGEIAFVFPGSGNHYAGMGRVLGVRWPEILREMDAKTLRLKTQMVPSCYMPWRIAWEQGWEQEAYRKIISDPLFMIFGQVVHGGVVANLVRNFGINPRAVIGYSLGESAGYFATEAWPERDEMLRRMRNTNLFTTELAGPCHALRKAWKIPKDQPVQWCAAVINRAAPAVRKIIGNWPYARLLIINTPDECVIGGQKAHVEAVIKELKCEAIFLDGVVTVHCDAALPVADAYKALHVFPTHSHEGIRYYSCGWGKAIDLNEQSAAESILRQATHGFDFPATIEQAYADGVRIFLEMGPNSSCKRMINRILHGKPHSAISACMRGEDDYLTMLKFLGTLIAERVDVNLDRLYGEEAYPLLITDRQEGIRGEKITRIVGKVSGFRCQVSEIGEKGLGAGDLSADRMQQNETQHSESSVGWVERSETQHSDVIEQLPVNSESSVDWLKQSEIQHHSEIYQQMNTEKSDRVSIGNSPLSIDKLHNSMPEMYHQVIADYDRLIAQNAEIHQQFLDFSDELSRNFGKAFAMQTQMLEEMMVSGEDWPISENQHLEENLQETGSREKEDTEPYSIARWELSASAPALQDTDFQEKESVPYPLSGKEGTQSSEPGDTSLYPLSKRESTGSQEKEETQSPVPSPQPPAPLFPREMCMEFAIGSIAKVLGPEFAEVDNYPVRVRLPDEPLMLVDRIMAVEGEKASLTSGRVITEHDVFPGAWYLDGDRAPVCISVEAGQADLFLCSYLGIDLKVKGKRAYRLLDAKVRFHRGLPRPGEIIQYDIRIDKFVHQGEVYMFFFRFEGSINGQPLISMRDGCAGFFTPEEVKNSGGIILTPEERQSRPGIKNFSDLLPMSVESYSDDAIEALRQGNAGACFGSLFAGIQIPESLRLPSGKMRLIDRVLHLDPNGGRFGLGLIQAEADIHPNDWFLTCHFVDDMVMPGTLMYECCAHTLRVFLQRMGWILDRPDLCYEPVMETEAVLKCRGPVTPETKHVVYEVEIKEIGYNPEPYVIADALMYGDGHKIVRFTDMSLKLSGATRAELEDFWTGRKTPVSSSKKELYTKKQLLAFCEGNPSEAFGEPYKIFDAERKIARLPRPPYFFMDRITYAEPQPWVLKPGGWIEAEYEMQGNEWYFRADRNPRMPFCILLEIALQPCGWLAAYAGSALKSDIDMKFRNLGGNAVLHRNLRPEPGTLTMRSRMTKVSEAGGMIIENFDMEILQNTEMIYKGDTYFGFFSAQALANQVGIQGAKEKSYEPSAEEMSRGRSFLFADESPLSPHDPNLTNADSPAMPAKALRMIDRIEIYIPDGGPHGLGFLRGVKTVDVDEWFFHAHFWQDPVCPGSLGLESFIQLMKFAALDRWPHLKNTHCFETVTDDTHRWIYRGQIIQKNKKVEVDAVITKIEEGPNPAIWASGYLKVDDLYIYQMKNFGLRLVRDSGI